MPTFSYKGYDFEVDHTPTEEEFQQMSAHVDTLPPKGAKSQGYESQIPGQNPNVSSESYVEPSLLEKAGAGIEAGVNTLAGAASMVPGALAFGTNLADKAIQEGRLLTPKEGEEAFQGGANIIMDPLMARTSPLGKEYTEKIGKGINELIPLAGLHGAFPAMKVGEATNAMKARFSKGKEVSKGIDHEALAQEIIKPPEKSTEEIPNLKATEGPDGQMALFDIPEEGRMPNPYEAVTGDWRIDENGIPIKVDLSMEAANLENARQRNLWGDELPRKHEQEAVPLTEAIDSMQRLDRKGAFNKTKLGHELEAPGELKAAAMIAEIERASGDSILATDARSFNERTRRQGGGVLMEDRVKPEIRKTENGYEAVVDGKVVGKLSSNITPEQGRRIQEPASIDFVGVDKEYKGKGVGSALYEAWSKDHAGEVVPSGKTSPAAWNLWKNKYPEKVDHFVKQEAQRIREGAPSDLVIGNITDPQIAQRVMEAAQSPRFVPKGQRGGIRVDYSKRKEAKVLKNIPGIKEKLGDILPDQRPTEQFLKEEASTLDVSQNLLQKGINMLTKGGVYQSIKTGNPLIKRVTDRFLDADRKAKAQIASIVHDTLAPLARDMSKAEKADVWAAQLAAEKAKTPLTEEVMRKTGFNDKQIKWVTTHDAVMKLMFEKMTEASKASGVKPVSPAVAYVASRAHGDFRKLVYDKEGDIVGILGAKTRMGLASDVKKLKERNPDYTIGEERYFGGGSKGGTAEGFNQMLEFLAGNDPKIKEFVTHVNDMMSKDAYDYMNAKSHTKFKKGIFGMDGKKPFEDAVKNAEEGMQGTIHYAEKMIKWAELSKAVADTKPLLKMDNELKMPNAKAWSEEYIQQALGNNPTEVGRAIENVFSTIGKSSGIGVTVPAKVTSAAKRIVNGLLLGNINIGFLAANLLQPYKSMPEMMSFLKGRGLEKSWDAGTGYRYLSSALMTIFKDEAKATLKPYEREALKYAKDNHVYSSDLFETSNKTTKDIGHYWDKATQVGATTVEMHTRQMTFLAYVEMLHDNGLTKADGMYEAAHKLTDIQMNNYSSMEAPRAYMALGGIGKTAYNLMSYKHNELSRLAMLTKEISRHGNSAPLVANIVSSVAFAGVMGTILYSEADWFTKQISKLMGKPTSLTKVLMDHPEISDSIKYGMGSTLGVDMTSRLGLGPLAPGSGHVIDAVMPGASKLVNIGKTGAELATHPSEYNLKNFVREASPSSVSGVLDRAWFSPKNAKGEEMSLNRNKVKVNAVRNDLDKLWKSIGMTGINEAKQKAYDYEASSIDRVYGDMRKSIIDNAAKQMFTSGRVPADFAQKYIQAQGDPASLEREITNMAMEQHVPAHTLALMKNAMSSSLTAVHRTMRLTGRE